MPTARSLVRARSTPRVPFASSPEHGPREACCASPSIPGRPDLFPIGRFSYRNRPHEVSRPSKSEGVWHRALSSSPRFQAIDPHLVAPENTDQAACNCPHMHSACLAWINHEIAIISQNCVIKRSWSDRRSRMHRQVRHDNTATRETEWRSIIGEVHATTFQVVELLYESRTRSCATMLALPWESTRAGEIPTTLMK